MKQPPFVNSQIYHIYNRGTDKRKIFMDDKDHLQFIHDLYEFNDEEPTPHLKDHLPNDQPERMNKKKSREFLVEVLAFVLMPNHYHLMVKQKVDNGISKYMQKLGTGYTMYFNEKHKRSGSLFQGRFKARLIKKDNHLLYLPFYIHLNPLKLMNSKISFSENWEFLKKYRWSSLPDYIGEKNFPSITQKAFLSKILGEPKEHKKEIKSWLPKDKNTIKNFLDDAIWKRRG